jgi:hypothetical protein
MMVTWRQFLTLIGFLLVFSAIFLFASVVHGYSPTQYYQAAWLFTKDSSGYLTATINGFNYGRVANGTYWSYPVSYMNPDRVFVANFEGLTQGQATPKKK